MVKLSVIVPVYNGSKYIKRCIRMIQKQTFKDYELIIVNDGSTDDTEKLCTEMIKEDKRMCIINKKNGGASDARNMGIDHACGKYVMFLDCDDFYNINFFKVMVETIEENKLDLAICSYEDMLIKAKKITFIKKTIDKTIIYQNNKDFLNEYIKLKVSYYSETIWNKIYDLDLIKKNNIRFSKMVRGEDVIFNLDYYKFVKKCFIIPDMLYYYVTDLEYPWYLKYSRDMYNMINKEDIETRKRLKKYNIYDNYAKNVLNRQFIVNCSMYLVSLFYKKFSLKDIRRIVCEVVKNDSVLEKADECRFESLYFKIITKCIKKRRINMLMMLFKIKEIAGEKA